MSDEPEQAEPDDTTDDPSEDKGADEVDVETIEKERSERLDPDNRPDHVEIDNSERTFDAETGMFTDSEEHDSAQKQFVGEQEQAEEDSEPEED